MQADKEESGITLHAEFLPYCKCF